MTTNKRYINEENKICAHNYAPVPVVIDRAQGIHAWDVEGKQYVDMMSAYSAVSFGHSHPKLIETLIEQAQQLNIMSRAFHTDQLAPYLEKLCRLTKQQRALPMNTGVEAVETALKAARKWAYDVKGVLPDQAEIIACENNFHGRTITVTSMSTEPGYRRGFGPFTPGFRTIPFADPQALEAAINENTAAFLVEPIQGEAGIHVPPPGYLKTCSDICKKNNVLLICDEIQSGMGRTGKLLAAEHDDVVPDGVIMGKSLGGGILPVSVFLSRADVMDVFNPGSHGSTFGGNQLACSIASRALDLLTEENLLENSQTLGNYFKEQLQAIDSPLISEVRGVGLMIGLEINPKHASAHDIVLDMLQVGLLSKDTHETVVRLAPPLIITKNELDECLEKIKQVIESRSGLLGAVKRWIR